MITSGTGKESVCLRFRLQALNTIFMIYMERAQLIVGRIG